MLIYKCGTIKYIYEVICIKKYLSLILSLIFIICLTSNTISFADNSKNQIENTLNKYFDKKISLLKNANTENITDLDSYFSDKDQNIYLKYEAGRAKYLINADITSKTNIENFNNTVTYQSIEQKSSEAKVEVVVKTSIKYGYSSTPCDTSVMHEIYLVNSNGKWLISKDIYSDDFIALYDLNTNFDDKISQIQGNYQKSILKENLMTTPTPQVIAGDAFLSYYPSNAVTYARSYTSEGTGYDGTSYNNSQFKYFKNGDDCQNFVSQCIWYGFGGRTSATTSNPPSYSIPMQYDWWASTTNTSTTWNWTGQDYFYNWATSNYANKVNAGYGVQVMATTVNNISAGDYIKLTGHVLFVSQANGTYNGL